MFRYILLILLLLQFLVAFSTGSLLLLLPLNLTSCHSFYALRCSRFSRGHCPNLNNTLICTAIIIHADAGRARLYTVFVSRAVWRGSQMADIALFPFPLSHSLVL